ncbi:hypothetical protein B5X24_HaOG204916 [Helicoverpa armigera]|uniref:Uncharacterized protein n=1 Tax=Helicoverpa armigera TaxID=29058 RepID=A0A2W1BM70_HELAM|nr:hypothetical protein B5X24_HaOG204916 [Helicoverpa armigera]
MRAIGQETDNVIFTPFGSQIGDEEPHYNGDSLMRGALDENADLDKGLRYDGHRRDFMQRKTDVNNEVMFN